MTDISEIEKFFCNACKGKTRHFIRGEYTKTLEDEQAPVSFTQRLLIIECCGCENLALVIKTHSSEDVDYNHDPISGKPIQVANWDEVIYPPVTYRVAPPWFDDLPDLTLREISDEIYKSLQTGSHYLAAFGSRTLIDRLIVLTVGDKGSFAKGLAALRDEGKISQHERDILEPVLQAGNAAAHRGWAPTKEQLAIILDTVEGLIHRLLVLPKLAEELEEAVPARGAVGSIKAIQSLTNVKAKIEAAPKDLRAIYEELASRLKALGDDVTVHPQKHYMAFRRNRNFASVQIYNRKKVVRVYLNVDPDDVRSDGGLLVRDVRQLGHFGTGSLEVTIKSKKDLDAANQLFRTSYEAS
jgi:predicted transport protein